MTSPLNTFLDSIRFSPPGGKHSIIWNKKGHPIFSGGIGFTFFINFDKQKRASLLLIKENPDLLTGTSIEEVSKHLNNFFDSFAIEKIGLDRLMSSMGGKGTVLSITPEKITIELTQILKSFLEETFQQSTFCIPIGISCIAPRIEGDLLWVKKDYDLSSILSKWGTPKNAVQNGTFPPLSDWKHRRYPLEDNDSWFIVRARNESTAASYFRRMAGALYTIIPSGQANIITGRKPIDGWIEFQDGGTVNITFKSSPVPQVSSYFTPKKDHAQMFWSMCDFSHSYRVPTCLEYLSESWGKSRVISFINCSIAMDALFGTDKKVKESILNGVTDKCSTISDAREKYDLILKIRNSILHGDHSTLEMSPHYLQYYDLYNNDPVSDQREILCECLNQIGRENLI